MSLTVLEHFDPSPILETWKSIGYSAEEQEMEQQKLNDLLIDTVLAYEERLGCRYQEIKEQVDRLGADFSKLMRAHGASDGEIVDTLKVPEGSGLKQKLHVWQSGYESYQELHRSRLQCITDLYEICTSLFERLQIPIDDRGEFAVIGDCDYTDARMNRFAQAAESLQKEVYSRTAILDGIYNSLTNLSEQLELPIPDAAVILHRNRDISPNSLSEMECCRDAMIERKNLREAEVCSKKREITKLWNILKVPAETQKKFLSQYSNLSARVVEAFTKELRRLETEREEHLAEIIENQRAEIARLLTEVNLPDCKITEANIEGKDLGTTYDILDKRIEYLNELYKEQKPCIDLIRQREDLLLESKELHDKATRVEEMRRQKKNIDPKLINRIEQGRRRIKSLLPRLERKLLLMLIEFEVSSKNHFEWNGKPYIDNLSHIKLCDVEIIKAKSGRKKSLVIHARQSVSSVCKKPYERRSMENSRKFENEI
jgi:hypothetical protein